MGGAPGTGIARWLVPLAVVLAGAEGAVAFDARVRWQPSGDPRVTGYNVHVRAAGTPYGTPHDARLPSPGTDGTLAYVVRTLTSGTTYHFAVTAYVDDAGERRESILSAELRLGTIDPCTIDRCSSLESCQFGSLADGAPCDDGLFCNGPERCAAGRCQRLAAPSCADGVACTTDSCDEALGRCRHTPRSSCCTSSTACADTDVCTVAETCSSAKTCVSTPVLCPEPPCTRAICDPRTGCGTIALPDGASCTDADPCTEGETCPGGACGGGGWGNDLTRTQLTLGGGSSGTRLSARTTFWPWYPIEPTVTGAILQLVDAGGRVLYVAEIPGGAFRTNRTGTSFRFSDLRNEVPSARGLRQLSLRIRNGAVTAGIRAAAGELDAALAEGLAAGRLTWSLRLGDECARALAVSCRSLGSARLTCR
jgi:hypothetical protein